MLTLLEVIKKTTEFFAAKGVEHPRLDAELLLAHALGLKRMQLYIQFERPLTEPDLEKIRALVRRRGQREPLQYIVGTTDFGGLTLKSDRRALIPRPETELLVEKVVGRVSGPRRILDLGTGSGAIALALAKQWSDAEVVAVDSSADALALAQENASATEMSARVAWLKSNWYDALPADSRFDLIAANPPYLTADETAQTAPEVRLHEPAQALTSGGADGLDDLKTIVRRAPEFLAEGGALALETGIGQHAALLALVRDAGFNVAESWQDLTGRDRFIFAQR